MVSRYKFSGSPVEVYKAWVNCCLKELCDIEINNLTEDLQDGSVLCKLIKLTTGHEIIQYLPGSGLWVKDVSAKHETITSVIDYLKSNGIEVSFQVEDITSGELKSILDVLWLIILHFEIHSASRAAYQRTVNLGKRFLLEWCSSELPDAAIDPRGTFMEYLHSGVLLVKLIGKHCVIDAVNPTQLQQELQTMDRALLLKVLNAAEVSLGIPKTILSSALALGEVPFDEYALMIYMAVLRRKVSSMRDKESWQGGRVIGQCPFKVKSPATMQKIHDCSTGEVLYNRTPLSGSLPLSPSALRDLVAQHTKSHAAIQALQERIQALSHKTATPRLQKKPPESLLKNMVPTEDTSLSDTETTDTTEGGLAHQILLTDHNENFLAVGKDDLLAILPCDGDTKELYTSVDKQFFELMLDAVQKGLIPSDLTVENWLNSDAADVALNGLVDKIHIDEPLLPVENETNQREFQTNNASMVSCGTETEMEIDEQMKAVTGISTPSETMPSMSITTVTSQDGEAEPTCSTEENSVTVQTKEDESDVPPAEQSVPGKKVHFLGLDTVFVDTQGSPEETCRASTLCDQDLDLDRVSNGGDSKLESSPRTTVTWAALDLPSAKMTRGTINNSHLKSVDGKSTGVHAADIVDSVDFEETIKEDIEDPFMLYLNSIEQTALKFKLQVEQAKVDTLEALKKKLELAYEGTPLEDIPVKFREKLQETIAEIASDEVLKKYEALVGQDDEMAEEENEIVECMRNELDSVASENFQLHQQLELLKDYEMRYLELREKFDSLDQEMTAMKNEYEKKNGESEFLAERVESLEKSIVNLRVEYNNEIRALQDENLQLQNTCFELESRNRVLEEEIQAADDTEYLKWNGKSDRNEHSTVNSREFEILQMRLEESERQNKALRAASQADQAMLQCMEDRKERLEGALVQSEDNHSKVLMELHEAQRHMSSDRVKLSSYQEEVEALRRENKLLKSSLEIAQQENEYLADKKDAEKSEPWKNNKRMIWREIRELEKILKDVHREKRTLEQKYVNFKQESDQLSNSLSLQCSSPPRESPEQQHPQDEKKSLKSKSWHSLSKAEKEKAEANGCLSDEESFSQSPPRKVKSWLDSLHSPNELARSDLHFDVNKNDETPTGANRPSVNGLIRNSEKTKPGNTEKDGSGFPNELEQLRHHVGSLEAEKAAIVKELSSLRFNRISAR